MNRKMQILVFLLLISLPLTLFVSGMRGEAIDNRAPRMIAPLSWSGIKSGAWFASINDYLIDRTPLREYAIRANANINWHVFNEVESPSVSRGKNGWLFYNNGLDQPCLKHGEIASRFQALAAIAKTQYARHGVRIYWLIAPNKEAIYPEMLTPLQTQRAACATVNRNTMREVLQNPALQPYIRGLWDVMEQHKPQQQLYRLMDSHWNHAGAAIGMQEMFHWIWPGIYRPRDIQPAETIAFKGDLSAMLGMDDMQEPEIQWKTIRPTVTGGLSPSPVCMKTATKRRRSFRHIATDARLVPEKVVILRDSFFDTPLDLVPSFFAQVDIGHIDHTPKTTWPAIAACADTLVIESVERSVLARASEFSILFPQN